MKKLFFFFAAMLVAITASAKIWEITPTSPKSKDNIRYCLRDNAASGDTILLTTDDTPYGESDAIAIDKSIVIMAAEGKHPEVNQSSSTKLSGGAIAKIIGLKFNGQGTCEYAFRTNDNSASAVTFEGCEFTGFTKYVITSSEGYHTDSCIINNCYFHDNGRAAVYYPKCNLADETINCVDYVKVTNTTITNITALNTAIIDVRNHKEDYTENIRLVVDHCTFYNWVGGSNGAVMSFRSPLSSVTNCIFAEPSTTTYYASYCYGGDVKNCLTYNLAGHRDWDTHPTLKDNITGDPLFLDAANGDYTLGAGSPALTAGTDGKAIGDPRWHPSVVTYHDFEIDLRDQQLGGDNSTGGSKYLIIDSENNYTYVDAEPASYNAFFEFANFNGSQHGYTNLKATIPVEAGNYKLTLGACGYGSGAGTVKNADLSETLASFNQQIEANNKCYHQNTTENIVTATFKVSAAQTIRITCGNYTPYIKLEKLEAQEFTVTFAAEGAEGSIPAARNVVDGEKLTLPVNRTLYKDGYTLTGWSDGENTYSTEFTPTANVTLTAVFTANAKGLLNAQTETIVKWYFGESNGCPTMHLEGGAGNGFVVAQATVDGESQDVKLAIDATSGKFYNKNRGDKWAQVNANTVFTFPSKKDITVVIEANSGAADYTLDGGTLTANANDYYSYLEVTYPASSATAIDNANANAKAVKSIVNGQLLITRDGKTYNVLGTIVK